MLKLNRSIQYTDIHIYIMWTETSDHVLSNSQRAERATVNNLTVLLK